MNVWMVYTYDADWEGGARPPEHVFADPGDAMIWADEEFDLTHDWTFGTDGLFYCKWYAHWQIQIESVPFTPFTCPAFAWGGPGHQSKHHCVLKWPHELADEHDDGDGNYWKGGTEEEKVFLQYYDMR